MDTDKGQILFPNLHFSRQHFSFTGAGGSIIQETLNCVCVRDFFCLLHLTQVVRACSSLRDVDQRGSGWDVQDLVVTKRNRDILETSRHLSTGGIPPTAHPTLVNHRAGAQHSIATLGLAGEEGEKM